MDGTPDHPETSDAALDHSETTDATLDHPQTMDDTLNFLLNDGFNLLINGNMNLLMDDNINLRLATNNDILPLARVATFAFTHWMDSVFPPSTRIPSSIGDIMGWHAGVIDAEVNGRSTPHKTIVIAVRQPINPNEAEEIVGFAVGMDYSDGPPGLYPSGYPDEDEVGIGAMGCLDYDAFIEWNSLDEAAKNTLGTFGPAWDLEMLAVIPQYRRRGVGTRLVRWFAERAKAADRGVNFILTTDSRMMMLRTCGFTTVRSNPFRGEMHHVMTRRIL